MLRICRLLRLLAPMGAQGLGSAGSGRYQARQSPRPAGRSGVNDVPVPAHLKKRLKGV
jgi:hypothetical protein